MNRKECLPEGWQRGSVHNGSVAHPVVVVSAQPSDVARRRLRASEIPVVCKDNEQPRSSRQSSFSRSCLVSAKSTKRNQVAPLDSFGVLTVATHPRCANFDFQLASLMQALRGTIHLLHRYSNNSTAKEVYTQQYSGTKKHSDVHDRYSVCNIDSM